MSLIRENAFVDGEWVAAASGKTFEVRNPFNDEVLARVPNMGKDDVDKAIDAAHKAFSTWRDTTAKERSDLLRKWLDLCRQNHAELASILTREQGKPLPESMGEVWYGNTFVEWFSEEARRNYGDVVPSNAKNRQMLFVREPVGVAGMITPWNFPSAMITRKAAAALAAGCTCVIKPAEDTPLSALALAALAEKAGFPKGVINVVTSDREGSAEVGKALCQSPKVGALSFTGSTKVGKILYRQCADTVKKLSLELGGNAPFIVFDSADVKLAVQGCMASKFVNSGQTCISSNRVMVQAGVYDEFLSELKAQVAKVTCGDGLKEGVRQGPMINARQHARVDSLVSSAVKAGAECLVGGAPDPSVGALVYKPTVVSGVTPEMDCFREEIFGPVAAVVKFKTEEEAVDMANDCRVGLAGYFYSNDVKQCWRVARKLEVGMVNVNETMSAGCEVAFGGVKESGLGREGSKYGMDEFSEIKYIAFGNL